MRAQHRKLAHPERRPVAVVTDSSADLADAVLDRHHIALVPLQVMFGDEVFRDRVELKPEEFYRRLRAAKELPTTSQPTPGEFVRVFRDARRRPTKSSAVLLLGGLSGTYQSAHGGARRPATRPGAPGGQRERLALASGMLALRGAELAESGWRAADIAQELRGCGGSRACC